MVPSWLKRWLFAKPPDAVPLDVVVSAAEPDGARSAPAALHAEVSAQGAAAEVVRVGEVVKALRQRGETLPVEAVAALGVSLVEQLRASSGAHLRGTSPDDVLLTRAGLVRVLGRPDRRTGLVGALVFMSPELVRGKALDEPSDVYSVCVLLFAAACGRPPIQRDGSDFHALQAIVEGRRASLDALRPGLPPAFVETIHRGLSADPLDRFPTLTALGEALAPFARDGSGRSTLLTMAFELVAGSVPPPPIRDAEEGRVLEAIANGDESARLVYADLLEERGLVDHARWLRLEAEVQRAPEAERAKLIAALSELRPRVGREFTASVGRVALEGCPIVFGFRCPMKWEQLRPTRDPAVRYCEGCASTVTYFDNLDEAQQASWAGKCVAIDPTVERFEDDLSPVAVMGRIA